MLNLYTVSTNSEVTQSSLTDGEKLAVYYHNIFDFPLSLQELIKWKANEELGYLDEKAIIQKSGYFYVEGGDGLVYKRMLRERISAKKTLIAKKASRLISLLPTVKMVAITGSLAMKNSSSESDIDLMVITKGGTLWLTRLITYTLLKLTNFSVRKPGDSNEKDRLCLNIWLDEYDLLWNKGSRNLYTAHEIAQIYPLANKSKIYEKFLYKNRWILDYWPNAVKIGKLKSRDKKSSPLEKVLLPFEKAAYKFQVNHMRGKKTREVVAKTRALFHPQDWGSIVLNRLSP
jgi:predicted nucleotidyltransferase